MRFSASQPSDILLYCSVLTMTTDSDKELAPPEGVDDNDNTPNPQRRSAPVDSFLFRKNCSATHQKRSKQSPDMTNSAQHTHRSQPKVVAHPKEDQKSATQFKCVLKSHSHPPDASKEHLEAVHKAGKGQKVAAPMTKSTQDWMSPTWTPISCETELSSQGPQDLSLISVRQLSLSWSTV